jgi:hypothetical protein
MLSATFSHAIENICRRSHCTLHVRCHFHASNLDLFPHLRRKQYNVVSHFSFRHAQARWPNLNQPATFVHCFTGVIGCWIGTRSRWALVFSMKLSYVPSPLWCANVRSENGKEIPLKVGGRHLRQSCSGNLDRMVLPARYAALARGSGRCPMP